MDQPQQRTWWGRNWKWVVPVGCLIPLLLCGGCVTTVLFVVYNAVASSDIYTESLARAESNEQVKALLGEPIEPGWPSANIQVVATGNDRGSAASGNADLTLPISGPKGSATLHAVAIKKDGKWDYSTLEVTPNGGGDRIDLRSKPEP